MPWSTYQGKEVVPTDICDGKVVRHDDHKETVTYPEKETVHVENFPEPSIEPPLFQKPLPIKERLNRRLCGIRAKWILLGLALLILSIVILGTGLGVGLRSR